MHQVEEVRPPMPHPVPTISIFISITHLAIVLYQVVKVRVRHGADLLIWCKELFLEFDYRVVTLWCHSALWSHASLWVNSRWRHLLRLLVLLVRHICVTHMRCVDDAGCVDIRGIDA